MIVYINNEPCEVTNMFDIDGEPTNDFDEAVSFVAKENKDRWHSFTKNDLVKRVLN